MFAIPTITVAPRCSELSSSSSIRSLTGGASTSRSYSFLIPVVENRNLGLVQLLFGAAQTVPRQQWFQEKEHKAVRSIAS